MSQSLPAKSDHLLLSDFRRTRFQNYEGARRFTPLGVWTSHYCCLKHSRMAVEHVFDFDRRDILAPRDDNVLGTVLYFDVPVLIYHREISGMEPALCKRLRRGAWILQISLHHDVAAKHDFTHGVAVTGHWLHGLRIEHGHAFLHFVAHALPRVELGTFGWGQSFPFGMFRAD